MLNTSQKFLVEYWSSGIPLKVRKVFMLQTLELPLDETYVLSVHSDNFEDDAIQVVDRFIQKRGAVFIRTAWDPDLLAAPWFLIQQRRELADVFIKLRQSSSPNRLTHMIFHGDSTNSSDPKDRLKYIAGRILFHSSRDIPKDRSIEMVHGEYFARLMDTLGFQSGDSRFARYEILVGKMLWFPLKSSPLIRNDDVRFVINEFKVMEDKIQSLRQVLALAVMKSPFDIALCIEFEVVKNFRNKLYIYDFDYSTR
jgi:hypothetical protein